MKGCVASLIFAALPLLLSAQNNFSNAPVSVHPDAIIQVHQAKGQADLVKVSVLDGAYPADLLQSQIQTLGTNVGSPARGMQIGRMDLSKGAPLLQGVFAVDGLLDPATGQLHLTPIIRAFMGAPAPYTVHQMLVDVDDQALKPGAIEQYNTKAIQVHRSVTGPSIEYQITLLSQNPADVEIPLTSRAPSGGTRGKAPGTDWFTIAIFGIAALAAGGLVYCLLIWSPNARKDRRLSNRVNK